MVVTTSKKLLNAVREAVRVVRDKWEEIAPEDYGRPKQRLRAAAVMGRSDVSESKRDSTS